MNISLSAQMEDFIRQKAQSGEYENPQAVLEDALRLLRRRDEEKLASLRTDLQHAIDQVERGEFSEYTAEEAGELAQEVQTQGIRKLAQEKQSADSRAGFESPAALGPI